MGARVLTNYSDLSDKELIPFSNNVLISLTGNTNFSFSEGNITKLATLITEFTDLVNTTGPKGVRINTTEKNIARKNLLDYLRTLATQVNGQAYGNETRLVSSGFKLAKTSGDVKLSEPTNLQVDLGSNIGSIVISIDKSYSASFNAFYYTSNLEETDITKMGTLSSTSTKVTVSGLESKTTYKVFAAYMGSKKYNKENEIKYCKSVLIALP